MTRRVRTSNGSRDMDRKGDPYFFYDISSDFSLKDQEKAAELLVRQVIRKSEQILKSERLVDAENRLPDHLEKFKRDFEEMEKRKQTVKLPIISTISPRSKKKISLLPPPNDVEKQKLDEIESFSKYIKPKTVYNKLDTKTLMASEKDDNDVTNFYNKVDNLKSRLQLPKAGTVKADSSATKYFDSIAANVERKAFQKRKIEELLSEKKVDNISAPSPSNQSLNQSLSSTWTGGTPMGKNKLDSLDDARSQTASLSSPISTSMDKKKLSPTVDFESLNAQKQKFNEITDINKKKEKEKEFLNNFTVRVYDEMGVDLNKEYNRVRRFKNCIKTIMVHFYKNRTAAAFAWWVQQTKKANIALQHSAATRINKAMLSAMYRINQAEKRRLRKEQFEAEMERRRKRALLLYTAANVIKRNIWKYVFRKLKAQKKAKLKVAIVLQNHYRGWKARVIFVARLRLEKLKQRSAILIQTAYRRSHAIRLVIIISHIGSITKISRMQKINIFSNNTYANDNNFVSMILGIIIKYCG